jgi:hypothetical protein
MKKHSLTECALNQFTGTEHWYRYGLVRDVLFTDGAKFLADEGGAYWLIDAIANAQRHEKAVAAEPFQVWKLSVRENHTGTLTCDDGNGEIVYQQELDYTDCPLPEITLYFTDNMILLPSEY